MRFEGTRKSNRDKGIDVFIFTMGREEMRLLKDLVSSTIKTMPKLFEMTPTLGRLRAINRTMSRVILTLKKERRG